MLIDLVRLSLTASLIELLTGTSQGCQKMSGVLKVMFYMKMNFVFMGKITEFYPKLSIFFPIGWLKELNLTLKSYFLITRKNSEISSVSPSLL